MKYVFSYEFKIGRLWICSDEKYLLQISFTEIKNGEIKETELIKKVKTQLSEYFKGTRTNFDIPLNLQGTEFQKKVWNELRKIPYGTTCSYKDIATKIELSKASRAVGSANNKNPIPIIVPCHRVIGINGKLTGYAGGLKIKKELLEHERKIKSIY